MKKYLIFILSFILSLFAFQNCSKVGFSSADQSTLQKDSGGLVQGSLPNTSNTSPSPTPSSQPPTSSNGQPSIDPNHGLCVLTCQSSSLENEDEDDGDSNAQGDEDQVKKVAASDSCGDKDDNDDQGENENGPSLQSSKALKIVQRQESSGEQPKKVCMSHTACDKINSKLQSGAMKLMKVGKSQVSPVKHASFLKAQSSSDCDEDIDDNDIQKEVDEHDDD